MAKRKRTRLERIRDRAQAASKGPWTCAGEFVMGADGLSLLDGTDGGYGGWAYQEADAEFMANARDDIPYLLAEVAGLRAKLAANAAVWTAAIHHVQAELPPGIHRAAHADNPYIDNEDDDK